MNPRTRQLVAAAVVMAAVLATAGCTYFVPNRPADYRLLMTVRSGEVWFRWCGSTSEHENLRISYSNEPRGGDVDEVYDGSGQFVVRFGQEFSAAAPPVGLEPVAEPTPIPVTGELKRVFVASNLGTSLTGDINGVFSMEDALALEGMWLSNDGITSATPCTEVRR